MESKNHPFRFSTEASINLSDDDELKYGTDPKKRDTDGDGYSDGEEVANGHDPLN